MAAPDDGSPPPQQQQPPLVLRLLRHIIKQLDDLSDLARAAAVDKAFAAASAEQIAQVSLASFTRKLPPKPACVETVSPIAGNILPMLHTALQEYHEALAEDGGSLSGYLVRGPMLHCGQLLDNSCAFRSIQMVLSSMMRQSEHRWPGVRSVMLDVPEARISQSNSVPSVRRLQRTLHKAWEAGFDTVGAEHTDNSTWIRGIVLNMPPNTPNALPFIGAPVVQPGLKYIGASDIWALMRWTGFRTELHDFIDGQTEDEPTAYHLLFEWCWSHFARHAREQPPAHASAKAPPVVHESDTTPLFLQWAGHAVCIVGAVRRSVDKESPPSRHLLIFNPEPSTKDLHRALSGKQGFTPPHLQTVTAPQKTHACCPDWWPMIAWSAKMTGEGVRIKYEEAMKYEAKKDTDEGGQGPGGENGPYQVLHLPVGWENREQELTVREPEECCSQHIGDKPAVNLRESNALKALASDHEGEDGYEVEVPEGVVPGDIIRIDLDSGEVVEIPVPKGAVPGTKLTALPSGVVVRRTDP